MTAEAATLRRILAALPLNEAGHRAAADDYEAMAAAHRAVADAIARGPASSPLADTVPPAPPDPGGAPPDPRSTP